jgi:DNA-binding LacI/PurR family transcriptional regulator
VNGAPVRAERPPIMADVARLAGVSLQTVSRVINGHPHIRPTTRSRVDDAIVQLGYRPNTMARALATKRSSTVGVVAQTTDCWSLNALQIAVQAAAQEAGYFVSVAGLETCDHAELVEAICQMRDHGADAVIVVAPSTGNKDRGPALRGELGLPIIDLNDSIGLSTGTDSCAGGRLATQHLIDLGHTDIIHLGGPSSWAEASARMLGWQQAMRSADLSPSHYETGDWTAKSAYEAGLVLAEHRRLNAVFCANDQIALGFLRAMHEVGLRVPADVSVVGFDDMPDSAQFHPPLTTVRQDLAAVGRNVIEVLRATMSRTIGSPVRAQPELVVRASTALAGGNREATNSMDSPLNSSTHSRDRQSRDESR